MYELGFTSTNLTYYDYKNIFVVENKIRMEKTGNSVFNPNILLVATFQNR